MVMERMAIGDLVMGWRWRWFWFLLVMVMARSDDGGGLCSGPVAQRILPIVLDFKVYFSHLKAMNAKTRLSVLQARGRALRSIRFSLLEQYEILKVFFSWTLPFKCAPFVCLIMCVCACVCLCWDRNKQRCYIYKRKP